MVASALFAFGRPRPRTRADINPGGSPMKRLVFPIVLLVSLTFAATSSITAQVRQRGQGTARLDLVEASIPDLLQALQTGLVTSEQLVEMYQARIAAYDDAGPRLNSYLTVNPNALNDARDRDAQRHPGIERSPLY